jgi:nitrite reductase/ring-hydroxylating ferredoxin subunit
MLAAVSMSRRAAISELVRAVAVAGSAVVGLLALRAARPTSARREPLRVAANEVTAPRIVDDVLLVPRSDGRVRAWSRRCPHLGCQVALDVDARAVSCPCHGSRFDLEGRRTAGPARADLSELAVTVAADGSLRVERD